MAELFLQIKEAYLTIRTHYKVSFPSQDSFVVYTYVAQYCILYVSRLYYCLHSGQLRICFVLEGHRVLISCNDSETILSQLQAGEFANCQMGSPNAAYILTEDNIYIYLHTSITVETTIDALHCMSQMRKNHSASSPPAILLSIMPHVSVAHPLCSS